MKFILFCLLLGACNEDATRPGELGSPCTEQTCEEGLFCNGSICTVSCQAQSAAAPNCYRGEGACLLTITTEGTVGLCYPKCDEGETCYIWGEPVIYRSVCVCIP